MPAPIAESAPAVDWLSAEEQVDWRAILEASFLLTEAVGRELADDAGLSLSEYEIMVRLSESPDRSLRMSDLAQDIVHSRSRLTHTIKRMEEAGMVERRACPVDRRGVLCVLTDEGFARLVAAAPGHVQAVRDHLVSLLTPRQFHTLGQLMAKLAKQLREVD